MTDKEILGRAIARAIEGGWDTNHFHTLKGNYKHPDESEFLDILGDWHKISPLDVIFNHEFAKALWGEHFPTKVNETTIAFSRAWEYHLQQMVISPNPIQYIAKYLEESK